MISANGTKSPSPLLSWFLSTQPLHANEWAGLPCCPHNNRYPGSQERILLIVLEQGTEYLCFETCMFDIIEIYMRVVFFCTGTSPIQLPYFILIIVFFTNALSVVEISLWFEYYVVICPFYEGLLMCGCVLNQAIAVSMRKTTKRSCFLNFMWFYIVVRTPQKRFEIPQFDCLRLRDR